MTLPVNIALVNVGYILPAAVSACFPSAGMRRDVDQLASPVCDMLVVILCFPLGSTVLIIQTFPSGFMH